MSFQIDHIVKVKTVGTVKVPRHEGSAQIMICRDDFLKVSVPAEITGKIEKIEKGQYFVALGNYENGKFVPSGRTMTFTQIYMSRFARVLC